jgi:signal transduction histidine kinase
MTQRAYQPTPPSPGTLDDDSAPASLDLVAALSHDLRGALTTVAGALQTLARHHDGPADPQLQQVIRSGLDGSDRMKRLLDDFLVAAGVLFGDVEVHPRAMDPGALLGPALRADPRLQGRVVVRSATDPRMVHLDPGHLVRLVRELVWCRIVAGSPKASVDVAVGSGRVVVVVVGDALPIAGDPARLRLGERIAGGLAAAMGGGVEPVEIGESRGYRVVLPAAEPPEPGPGDGPAD